MIDFLTNITWAYLFGVCIAFLQGYFFVAQYRMLYVFFLYIGSLFGVLSYRVEKRDSTEALIAEEPGFVRLSSFSLFSEILSLLLVTAFLLVPYKLYFTFVWVFPRTSKWAWLTFFVFGYLWSRVSFELKQKSRLSNKRIYIDYSKLDEKKRIVLNSFWTMRDLERHYINLSEGQPVKFYGNDQSTLTHKRVEGEGVFSFDEDLGQWLIKVKS